MPIRTGQQYMASMRRKVKDMEVYLNGRRVKDVTMEPLFQGPMQSIAEQYDMQYGPAYRNVLTYASPTTGDPIRLTTGTYLAYDKELLFEMVERASGNRDAIPIPISPTHPGAAAAVPTANDRLTHTYPAASQPRRSS